MDGWSGHCDHGVRWANQLVPADVIAHTDLTPMHHDPCTTTTSVTSSQLVSQPTNQPAISASSLTFIHNHNIAQFALFLACLLLIFLAHKSNSLHRTHTHTHTHTLVKCVHALALAAPIVGSTNKQQAHRAYDAIHAIRAMRPLRVGSNKPNPRRPFI